MTTTSILMTTTSILTLVFLPTVYSEGTLAHKARWGVAVAQSVHTHNDTTH